MLGNSDSPEIDRENRALCFRPCKAEQILAGALCIGIFADYSREEASVILPFRAGTGAAPLRFYPRVSRLARNLIVFHAETEYHEAMIVGGTVPQA